MNAAHGGYRTDSRAICGHRLRFDPPPRTGDIVWCAFCADYRRVTVGDISAVKRIKARYGREIAS